MEEDDALASKRGTYASKYLISVVQRETVPSISIQPSMCQAKRPTVAAHFLHYARESRRHHHARKFRAQFGDVTTADHGQRCQWAPPCHVPLGAEACKETSAVTSSSQQLQTN